jgi:hypothetical protein
MNTIKKRVSKFALQNGKRMPTNISVTTILM